MEKELKQVWKVGPLCIFLVSGKIRNSTAFSDEVWSIEKVTSFFCKSPMAGDQDAYIG